VACFRKVEQVTKDAAMNTVSKKTVKDYLKQVLHASPLFVIKGYMFLYAKWYALRSFLVPVHHFNGKIHGSGETLVFMYLGWDRKILSYWLRRIFTECDPVSKPKYILSRHIDRFLNQHKGICDVALVELSSVNAMHHAENLTGFVLPRWVKMYMDVEQSMSVITRNATIPRRIRKHALGLERANTEADFEFLYDNMYKPYISARHMGSAVLEDRKKMTEDFRLGDSTIYFITREGRRIAGLYEQYINGEPYMHGGGVLDGSEDFLKMGVIGALYYYALENYQHHHVKRVNIGGTSPLLTDGLTAFKISLGAKVSEIPRQDSLRLKLIPLSNSKGLKDFLTGNAFAYIENDSIYCAVFSEKPPSEAADELEQRNPHVSEMGVNRIRVFYFREGNGIVESRTGT
jgi:hypothetical protein